MVTKLHYDNPTSQAERREVAKNDRGIREAGTFHGFAASEADVVGGRYGAISKSTVTGSSPAPRYPPQPANVWASDTGLEPPLGTAVDEMVPVGTYQEVEQSIMRGMRKADPQQESHPPSGRTSRSGDEGTSRAGRPSRRSKSRKVKR